MKFSSRNQLYLHVKLHCSGEISQCPVCKALFPTLPVLFMHLHVHCGWHKLTCRSCKNHFGTKSDLKHHPCLYRKLYICEICNATIKWKRKFEKHKLKHLQTCFKCKICNKMFEQKSNLDNHKLSHSQKKKSLV